jgi:hypothetical protein
MAHPIQSPIQSPSGPIPISFLSPGDVVFDLSGGVTRIESIDVSKEERRLFQVGFSDSRSLQCSEDQVWKIPSLGEISTEKLLSHLANGPIEINPPEAVEYEPDHSMPLLSPEFLAWALNEPYVVPDILHISTAYGGHLNKYLSTIPEYAFGDRGGQVLTFAFPRESLKADIFYDLIEECGLLSGDYFSFQVPTQYIAQTVETRHQFMQHMRQAYKTLRPPLGVAADLEALLTLPTFIHPGFGTVLRIIAWSLGETLDGRQLEVTDITEVAPSQVAYITTSQGEYIADVFVPCWS